jgi:hypothetical protein
MPVYSRRNLRQSLGTRYLRSTIVSATSGSWGTQAGSANIIDSSQADPTASGEQLYQRHWLRLLGSAGVIQDLRVGSFNTGSGAYLSAQTLATTVFSGMPYELHALMPPTEMDQALTDVIADLRTYRELAIWATPESYIYSLGPDVLDVLDVRILTAPTGSLNRGEYPAGWWKTEQTATRYELRIDAALLVSQQLLIGAITSLSLGAGDLATVNLPSDEWLLSGAAARCYWLLDQRVPGQVSAYGERRREMARRFTALSGRFQPVVSRKVQLDNIW